MNTDGLKALAGRRTAKPKKEWAPPSIQDFCPGTVMAFDPSLAKTAMVLVEYDLVNGLTVLDAEMLKTTSTDGLGGHEENLERAVQQGTSFIELLARHYPICSQVRVVHEAVPVGGGKLRRPESSLLASLALRLACGVRGFGLAPSVAVAAHRKAICGNARADKPEAHRALAELATSLPITGYELITNEDKRDALCVALTHLLRGA